jgi:hypothetical protein
MEEARRKMQEESLFRREGYLRTGGRIGAVQPERLLGSGKIYEVEVSFSAPPPKDFALALLP